MNWEIVWFYYDNINNTIKQYIMCQYVNRTDAEKDLHCYAKMSTTGFYRICKIKK